MKTKLYTGLFLVLLIALTYACGEVEQYPSGNVSGWIFAAEVDSLSNDEPIILGDVTVTITYAEGAAEDLVPTPVYSTISSAFDGSFNFYDIEAGKYYLEVTAPAGRVALPDGTYEIAGETIPRETFDLFPNENLELAPIALPSTVPDYTTAAVLTWASTADLDMHATYPTSDWGLDPTTREMVYWNNAVSSVTTTAGEPVVELQMDIKGDITNGPGYGPEMTYFTFDAGTPQGEYYLSVYAYDDATDTDSQASTTLGDSGATVRFCDYVECWLKYTVPKNTAGNLWSVALFYWESTYPAGSPYLFGYDMFYLENGTVDDTYNFALKK